MEDWAFGSTDRHVGIWPNKITMVMLVDQYLLCRILSNGVIWQKYNNNNSNDDNKTIN